MHRSHRVSRWTLPGTSSCALASYARDHLPRSGSARLRDGGALRGTGGGCSGSAREREHVRLLAPSLVLPPGLRLEAHFPCHVVAELAARLSIKSRGAVRHEHALGDARVDRHRDAKPARAVPAGARATSAMGRRPGEAIGVASTASRGGRRGSRHWTHRWPPGAVGAAPSTRPAAARP